MAAIRPPKPPPPARPGFNPAAGQSDPTFKPPAASFGVTHYPNRDRGVCGVKSTEAAAYSMNPTCPTCAAWLKDVQANTARRHPEATARAVEAQRAAAAAETPAPDDGAPPQT